MKVYVHRNHDGRHSTMVAAENLKAAAFVLGTSTRQMREFGWRFGNETECALALPTPGVVFKRQIGDTDGDWVPARSAR